MHTNIICEIGSNHDGHIRQAYQMIKLAKSCGADVVKFQIFKAKTLYVKNTKNFNKYKNVYKLIEGLEVPLSFFRECKNICDDNDIEFLATPFDEEAIDFLMELNVKRMKIASFEFSDMRLLDLILQTKLPILASTGLASVSDIERFMSLAKNSDITLLHCNSAYPTPDRDVHIRAIPHLLKFCSKVGYSDHSEGILAPILSVGLGACVIEKHFTLDRKKLGPDHPFAIEPKQFADMVKGIRECEVMLGEHGLYRSESEKDMMYAKRSIVADKFIPKGKIIETEDITTKRPGSGIPAIKYFDVIGLRVIRNIEKDDIIKEDDLEFV